MVSSNVDRKGMYGNEGIHGRGGDHINGFYIDFWDTWKAIQKYIICFKSVFKLYYMLYVVFFGFRTHFLPKIVVYAYVTLEE